jgi:chromosome segregation ATPase
VAQQEYDLAIAHAREAQDQRDALRQENDTLQAELGKLKQEIPAARARHLKALKALEASRITESEIRKQQDLVAEMQQSLAKEKAAMSAERGRLNRALAERDKARRELERELEATHRKLGFLENRVEGLEKALADAQRAAGRSTTQATTDATPQANKPSTVKPVQPADRLGH